MYNRGAGVDGSLDGDNDEMAADREAAQELNDSMAQPEDAVTDGTLRAEAHEHTLPTNTRVVGSQVRGGHHHGQQPPPAPTYPPPDDSHHEQGGAASRVQEQSQRPGQELGRSSSATGAPAARSSSATGAPAAAAAAAAAIAVQKNPTRWSLILLHSFTRELLAHVKKTGRPIKSAPALYNQHMGPICRAAHEGAIALVAQHGETMFAPVDGNRNPCLDNSKTLGDQVIYKECLPGTKTPDTHSGIDAAKTLAAKAAEFRRLELRTTGVECLQRESLLAKAARAEYKSFELPTAALKRVGLSRSPTFSVAGMQRKLKACGAISEVGAISDKDLVHKAIYGHFVLYAYDDGANDDDWILEENAVSIGVSKFNEATDKIAWEYKSFKFTTVQEPVVGVSTSPQAVASSTFKSVAPKVPLPTPARTSGQSNQQAKGGTTSAEKLAWGKQKREHQQMMRDNTKKVMENMANVDHAQIQKDTAEYRENVLAAMKEGQFSETDRSAVVSNATAGAKLSKSMDAFLEPVLKKARNQEELRRTYADMSMDRICRELQLSAPVSTALVEVGLVSKYESLLSLDAETIDHLFEYVKGEQALDAKAKFALTAEKSRLKAFVKTHSAINV